MCSAITGSTRVTRELKLRHQVVLEEFLKRFQKLGFGGGPPPQPQVVDPEELERLVQNAVRAALGEKKTT